MTTHTYTVCPDCGYAAESPNDWDRHATATGHGSSASTDIALLCRDLVETGFAHADGTITQWRGDRGEETSVELLALSLLTRGWTHPDITEGRVRS